jgi:hypothetical protein
LEQDDGHVIVDVRRKDEYAEGINEFDCMSKGRRR